MIIIFDRTIPINEIMIERVNISHWKQISNLYPHQSSSHWWKRALSLSLFSMVRSSSLFLSPQYSRSSMAYDNSITIWVLSYILKYHPSTKVPSILIPILSKLGSKWTNNVGWNWVSEICVTERISGTQQSTKIKNLLENEFLLVECITE